MIDSHVHLNFPAFQKDLTEVLERAKQNGIDFIINVGADYKSSQIAVRMAQDYECLFATIGFHPESLSEGKFDAVLLESLIKQPKVVAVGECGLDYFRIKPDDFAAQKLQQEIFITQIESAKKFNLPLILHCRSGQKDPELSYQQMLEILKKEKADRGVLHCFSGDWRLAKEFIESGFYIGLTGIITFPNYRHVDLLKNIPLDNVLIETDCPFLAPQPVRGQRNEPAFVKYVAEHLANIKNINLEEVDRTTTQNTKKLFNIEN
ncbi:MAG: TatD family hydrolase [Patescibacteria group bacterium]